MLVKEIFISIQGESTRAGLPCIFIRLAGCNLRCEWCDTVYAQSVEGADDMTAESIIERIGLSPYRLVELTGGEPLLQQEAKDLSRALLESGYKVLIETNGSVSLKGLPEGVVKIIDVKCPSSGHAGCFLMENLDFINPEDEIKFVIGDREDYEYAKRFIDEFLEGRTQKILFAPVKPDLAPKELADWILKDGLKVRLQLQLHSYIWPNERGR